MTSTAPGPNSAIPSYRAPEAARDRIVALCGDIENARVLDVGSGDGLVGRSLLPLVGPNGSVTFVDHDPETLGKLDDVLKNNQRARAVVDDASELRTIDSHSIDLVVMRAVLLYIPDKHAALQAAARVLRPNGRIVISEPVNRPLYFPPERFWGFDLSTIPDIATKLQQGFVNSRDPAVRSMFDWDDIQLASAVAESGFTDVRSETFTEVVPGPAVPWLAFLHARWTPWLPTMAQVMSEQLTFDEERVFEQVVRPQLASGKQHMPLRITFVTATRE